MSRIRPVNEPSFPSAPRYWAIANWKMNLGYGETVDLTRLYRRALQKQSSEHVRIVLCPSFPALAGAVKEAKGTLEIGAQDCFWEHQGAFTGEVSAAMLKEIGCQYVIVGHSELRQNAHQNNGEIRKKMLSVLNHGLTPIVCVGELWEHRKQKIHTVIVAQQLRELFDGMTLGPTQRCCIAYEPIWVIGRGQPVDPLDVFEMRQNIVHALMEHFDHDVIEHSITLLYGGSVNAANVQELVVSTQIDGVLVGSASLHHREFLSIVAVLESAAQTSR